MIHNTLIRYAFDATGHNPNNYVKDEQHTLADKRFRAIAPVYGIFYSEGFTIVDRSTGQLLVRGQDYVFAELHQALSLEIGQEIVGIAIVTNTNVSSDVSISYQCVGGDFSVDSSTMESLLVKTSTTDVSNSWFDIDNRPTTFTPSPHLHDLGDVDGMEVLVYQLERIRNIILWSESNSVESIMVYVMDILDSLTARLINRVQTEYLALVIQYKRNFTKAFAGLGNVENIPLASSAEGRNIFNGSYFIPNIQYDKYVTTEALIAFKEVLYSVLVSSEITQIGKTYPTLLKPKLNALKDLPVGATFLLDTLKTNKSLGIDYDLSLYPTETAPNAKWSITKMAPKANNLGAVIIAVNLDSGELYTGNMKVSTSSSITTIQWYRHMNENDTSGFLDKLIAHMQDNNNPHKERKKQIGLSDVENLPVATKEDIICRKPVRKYITYDGLLLYAKAFLTGIKDTDDIEQDDTDTTVLEKYQLIFAPCGPCGNLKEITVPVTKCDEAGKLLFTFCADNFVKTAMYADGNCGTYTEVLEENSVSCGYTEPVPAPTPVFVDRFSLGWYEVERSRPISSSNPTLLPLASAPVDDAVVFGGLNWSKAFDLNDDYGLMDDVTQAAIGEQSSSCAFGVDDGFWEEGMVVSILDSNTTPAACQYFSATFNFAIVNMPGYQDVNNSKIIKTVINDEGYSVSSDLAVDQYGAHYATEIAVPASSWSYTAQQAEIMLKLIKARTTIEVDANTGEGTVTVSNPGWGIMSSLYSLALGTMTIGQFLQVEGATYGFEVLTREELQLFLSEGQTTRENYWLPMMLLFPVGDIRIGVTSADGRLRGWLLYFQTLGNRNQVLSPMYQFSHDLDFGGWNGDPYATYDPYPIVVYKPGLLRCYNRWFGSIEEENAERASDVWYSKPSFSTYRPHDVSIELNYVEPVIDPPYYTPPEY